MISLLRRPRGGVYPDNRKARTRTLPVWNAAVPPRSVVPLLQHAGDASIPVVRVGDRVREGMLIGRAAGTMGANVHAPVPGIVTGLRTLTLADGRRCEAFVIDLEGEFDRLGKHTDPYDWDRASVRELLRRIGDCGVVGMSGSGIPVHRKYRLPRGKEVDHLIVNGIENEPYLSADYRLMVEMTDGVLEGTRIAERILKPLRVTIAVQADSTAAASGLRQRIRERGLGYAVRCLPRNYPQGDEKLLARAITGREVPTERSTVEIGVMVSSVATVHAVFEAVAYEKPSIERVLTLSGGALRTPANVKARIGTPVADLIAECGGFAAMPEKVVIGGPMMGYAIADVSTPVTKGTTAVLALTTREIHHGSETPCIRCGRCVRACPVGLEPTLLYKMLEHHEYVEARDTGLFDCIECGCCGFTCPAHIPLVEGIKNGKNAARTAKERS
ncbi:MAG: electron transport complex subunit RsxC [Spirochaetaceae bacterium]|nr:MAG: electron transport complex subunit RsxC [Spirochaetaceae bacterium]